MKIGWVRWLVLLPMLLFAAAAPAHAQGGGAQGEVTLEEVGVKVIHRNARRRTDEYGVGSRVGGLDHAAVVVVAEVNAVG